MTSAGSRSVSADERSILLTFDTDWAPDWMIAEIADILVDRRMRATWFVTNDGPAIQALRSEPLFEVGLHPNFLPGSSHGASPDEAMAHLKSIVPDAVSVRTHSLCQAEPWLKTMVERFGIAYDCSIHLPLQSGIAPHVVRLGPDTAPLVRLPHVFQDNMYMFAGKAWSLNQRWFASPGLKVFCFHPIHVVMNANSMTGYERAKLSGPVSSLQRKDVPRRAAGQGGCMDLMLELLDHMRAASSDTVRGYASNWAQADGGRSAGGSAS